MHEQIPFDERSETNAQKSHEDGRRIEALLAEDSELHVEGSKLQEQLTKTLQELVGVLSAIPTEDSRDRVSELQERLEEIHDRQHELTSRQALAEQAAIRRWSTSRENNLL
jgi:hypothetical protein